MPETQEAEIKTLREELQEIDRLISENGGSKLPVAEAPVAPLEETAPESDARPSLLEDVAALRESRIRNSETGNLKKWGMFASSSLCVAIDALREASRDIGDEQKAAAIRRIVETLESVEEALGGDIS